MDDKDHISPFRFDFSMTQGEAQERFGVVFVDWLALKATPLWFEWLGWVLVLAAFEYLAIKSHWWVPRTIVGLSAGALLVYFQAFFYRFEFTGLPLVRSRPKLQRACSLAFSGAFAYGAWTVAVKLAHAIGAATP